MGTPAYTPTGTIHHWYRLGNGNWNYLGTCQVQPEVVIQEMHEPVFSMGSGSMVPSQMRDEGQMAQIAIALNHYDRAALLALRTAVAPSERKIHSRGDVLFGKKDFELLQVAEQSITERGWWWRRVLWIGDQSLQTGTGIEQARLISLQAYPKQVAQSSYSNWVLYTTSDIPNLTVPYSNG